LDLELAIVLNQQEQDRLNFHRPPLLGRRLKLMMCATTAIVILGAIIQHWWTVWVRHGLGW
jgi:hypothetical protein